MSSLPPDKTERLLERMQPLLEGFSAIAQYLAQKDIDAAFKTAKQFANNAKILNREVRENFEVRDRRRRRPNHHRV